jgi:putative transposase
LGRAEREKGARELMALGMSVRRACFVWGLSTSSLYEGAPSPKAQNDEQLVTRLRAMCRPGQGYRLTMERLRPAWEKEHGPLNHKRVFRLWKGAGLSLPKRRKKKRSGQSVPGPASGPHQVWCLDFCHDACLNGQKLKILAVKDEYTRVCLALVAGTSMKSLCVQRTLARLFREHGVPALIRSDNGPEFIAHPLAIWLALQGSAWHFITPGSPWQNGHAESFNSRLRAECLDAEVFFNLADAQIKLELYRQDYNHHRPHSALGYQTPNAFGQSLQNNPSQAPKPEKGNGE